MHAFKTAGTDKLVMCVVDAVDGGIYCCHDSQVAQDEAEKVYIDTYTAKHGCILLLQYSRL